MSRRKWNNLTQKVARLEGQVLEIQAQHQYNADEATKCLKKAMRHFATSHDNAPEYALQPKNLHQE